MKNEQFDIFYVIHFTQKEIQESGQWKPDVEEEECGQDLNLAFITCDDEDGCYAKQYEFPYMV